ncbi:MAG: sugar ABC transporter permease [Treponema sp.]|jgi:multiple sugar transport system permease protein|nr:sugar ABC transporter permease [Treponema sp.]
MKKQRAFRRSRDARNSVAYGFMAGYLALFSIFIIIPVLSGVGMSLTYFNTIQPPRFVGLKNFIDLLTQDLVFMQNVIPNTIQFSIFTGAGGYALAFVLAWLLAQLTRIPRTILAIVIYSPSLTSGVVMSVIWKTMFSGDAYGYVNNILLNIGVIDAPIQFLQSPDYLMLIMIIVSIWNSMGIGFLAMLAGILNVNQELYDAGAIDGIRNRVQEVIYITIPSMKPQMLFGAVMAVVNTFNVSSIGVQLSGENPTPQYAGQLVVSHIEDFGFIRYEMGYAAAISVMLLLFVYGISKIAFRLFADKD